MPPYTAPEINIIPVALCRFDDLITSYQLIDVFTRTSIKQQASKICGAFPRLEATFVDACLDIELIELVDHFIVFSSLAKQLNSNIIDLTLGQV